MVRRINIPAPFVHGTARAGLLPNGAGENLSMERLDSPATLDELVRQRLEQLWMGRGIPANAKVAGRPHEALAEMLMPNPVDDDSSQQRPTTPLGIRDPIGKRATL